MPTIHTIDLHYLGVPEMIACYVVVGPNGPVLVETGPSSCLAQLERGLCSLGMSLDDIRHALVTHIHLDHAGAAGHLARRGIAVHVHEFGAQHLIDPTRLAASAKRIYGDEMDRLWGTIVPAPADRIVAVNDNDVIEVAGLRFVAIETPGHARHHHAYALAVDHGSVCFTGDAAGMIIPGLRFINLPTPPPEFDLDLWMQSIERLERQRFRALYLTHFGMVRTPLVHLTAVKQAVRSHTEYVRAKLKLGQSELAIMELYAGWVRRQAERAGASDGQLTRFISDNLLRMNVTGILRYLSAR
jgi:glyoxylase-like metal-dependent hydrolase (beta-lactamase superfamily II)